MLMCGKDVLEQARFASVDLHDSMILESPPWSDDDALAVDGFC